MISLDDLNKTQLVLLTLLISFVTSVAAGIITTSLLAQAPLEVTQTINRVVERTVEKVVPVAGSPREVSLTKEDQALLASVNKATQAVVDIAEVGTSTPLFTGVIVSQDGIVVSGASGIDPSRSYYAIMSDNTKLPLAFATSSARDGVTIFRIQGPATAE